eukprot:jgi/Mesvir1/27120/Mv20797-RA.1
MAQPQGSTPTFIWLGSGPFVCTVTANSEYMSDEGMQLSPRTNEINTHSPPDVKDSMHTIDMTGTSCAEKTNTDRRKHFETGTLPRPRARCTTHGESTIAFLTFEYSSAVYRVLIAEPRMQQQQECDKSKQECENRVFYVRGMKGPEFLLRMRTCRFPRNFQFSMPEHKCAFTRLAMFALSYTGATNKAVRFRPCIDIHQGKVKQIVGSTLRDMDGKEGQKQLQVNFETEMSSAEFARMYKRDGLLGGHIIMLGADPASERVCLEALAAYPGGFHVGGGVNPGNASKYLDNGASHVIVTSYVFRDGRMDSERLRELVAMVGKERLVLDLSCRKKDGKYMVVTDRWQRFSELAVDEATLCQMARSADEFLVHGVDVEGMKLGIDEELVDLLGRFSPIPVTYAGGARSLEDLERVKVAGHGAVDITVGSALDIFGGDLAYSDVVAWHKRQMVTA